MPKILVAPQPHFLPVLKLLHRVPEIEFLALVPQAGKLLTEADLPVEILTNLVTSEVHEQALTNAARILRVVLAKQDYADLDPSVAEFLETHKPAFFYTRIADLCVILEALEAANPDLVLVHNDVEPLTRLACWWARAHNKPSLHVPHAIYLENKDRPNLDIHDMVTATNIAVASPYQAQWYYQRDPQAKITVTGLPQYDRWANQPLDHARATQLLGLDPGKPVVCYASSWRQDTNLCGCHDGIEESYTNFLKAIRRLKGVQVIVKTHPSGQNLEYHAQTAKELGVHCVITNQYLDQVLQGSDLVISYGPSNLLLEAAHIPWVRLACTDGFYADPEVLKCKPETEDFYQLIQASLANPAPDKRAFLERYLGVRDGRAHERIASLILELLAENSTGSANLLS